MGPSAATYVIHACVQLHNFVIDEDGVERALAMLEKSSEHHAFTYWQDELSTGPTNYPPSGSPSARFGQDLRKDFVCVLQDLTVTRP